MTTLIFNPTGLGLAPVAASTPACSVIPPPTGLVPRASRRTMAASRRVSMLGLRRRLGSLAELRIQERGKKKQEKTKPNHPKSVLSR